MAMLVKPVLIACLAASALAGGTALGARDWQDGGQEAASQRRQTGGLLPLRVIEARVKPMMPGAQYLGFDFDPQTNIYTLKFLRNGSVIWVDVDGRTGRILRKTGN
ncbi:hypothetical protein [Sphingomonas sp. AOB5]|uniref:hypothetical protein n=1 Tax=Sphingomonas sp. AOB5 TaxID=3034017 RepID=UPI0023F7B599|nr:hypothetical protein [Sphingomonas sp. AOB5]